jgi:hypothetical protein
MRSVILVLALVIFATLFSACSSVNSALRTSDCTELEGNPDCQDGHRVDFTVDAR